jgi:hypothetical protein
MRKRLAVGISLLAVSVLVALSVLFALRQNPADGARLDAAAVLGTATGRTTAATTTPSATAGERQPGRTAGVQCAGV